MALTPLTILPGLFTIPTDRGANGRWKNGDKVRFRHGMPEKLGGWQRSGTNSFLGKCRALTDWKTLALEKMIGLGTHLKLYVWFGGAYYNITPLRDSGTLGEDPFTTTNGSAVVKVTHAGHGCLKGDFVSLSGATEVGGLTIDGEYRVTEVIDENNYTITHTAAANADATGGDDAVTYEYEIHIGLEDSIAGLGWGAGTWSAETWGTPRTIMAFLQSARIWSLDQWGEDLIACPRDGSIYVWDRSSGTNSRATLISEAPQTAKAIMVSPENKHLIAFGAHNGVAPDPMLIRWSSSENYTSWTPDPSNSAGAKRLTTGNEIVCAIKARNEILVFTDSHLWSMRFVGPPNYFAFKDLGKHGGVRGPNAVTQRDGIVYWMGDKEFYRYNGAVQVVECDVHPTVFKDINAIQGFKVYAVSNHDFSELWWLYCSAASKEVDRYVIYNPLEKHWSFGTLARTAMVGDSDVFQVPYATGTDGYLYDHETGTDDDSQAMVATLESGDVELDDGERMLLVHALVPDFKEIHGSITLTLHGKRYPMDEETVSTNSITITQTTKFVNPRVRGRQVSFHFRSDQLGDFWRMGTSRIGVRAIGRK